MAKKEFKTFMTDAQIDVKRVDRLTIEAGI